MSFNISEKRLEDDIEAGLLANGYKRRDGDEYDAESCMLPAALFNFVVATQPKPWDRFKKTYDGDSRERFLARVAAEVARRGVVDCLRKGVKCDGVRFALAYFQPASGLNDETLRLYAGNELAFVRQLRYSAATAATLDLALFLNGLPLFTVELKNPLTGQNVQDAVRQYRQDRDPREPLFAFGRCLTHVAVDPDFVYQCTHLQGAKSRFLPFNKGRYGGAGNPPAANDYASAYLWREVWARDSILDLVKNFVHVVEEEDDRGRKTGARALVFPRYHQLDCVRRLLSDARERGPGRDYLIQHSAGSGKSYSIAWLAHQLSTLHDADDQRVFDSVVVLTDRRVLDRQLQRHVRQFEQVAGVVENIDTTSKKLKQALQEGKTIIVSTLQKFPFVVEDIGKLPGKRFAVVVDEAHSSQGGEGTKSVKDVLAVKDLEAAEKADVAPTDDLEDRILAAAERRGHQPNISYFAFTATPKAKTMQRFGEKQADGSYLPFSLYSMRQAIEENFILDVLDNYTTYKEYWKLLKTVENDPRYEKGKANYLLRQFVDLHEHTIDRKVAIMVEHFAGQVMGKIGGRAKAMIVTRSRLHAVRYKFAVDNYIKERGYGFKALVAFSGTVRDGGADYTEAGMNGFPEAQTADAFKRDENRLMIVAYKFQTGFDQPFLHTMYVDQKLGGVRTVQTLSRLNRTFPGKEETMVLDFANDADAIQKDFEPYYDRTFLVEGTDPNILYDRQTAMEGFHYYDETDLNRFAREYFAPKANQAKLYAALEAVVDRYAAAPEEERLEFRGALVDFVRLYAFLSQILPFADADLEKLYVFGRYLRRRLPSSPEQLPVEIQRQIDLDSLRIQKTSAGKIRLPRGKGGLEPLGPKGPTARAEDVEPLSAIIKELNERFGTDFSGKDKVFIEKLEAKLRDDPALALSVIVNRPENARLTFDHVANDKLQEMVDTDYKFFKQVNDNGEFAKALFDWLFERYLKAGGKEHPR